MPDCRHRTEHIEHFDEHGWVLIEELLTPTEIEAAYPGLFSVYPTAEAFHSGDADFRSSGFKAISDSPANAGEDPRFRPMQFAGLREFPFSDQTLNLLALHPAIIAVVESVLNTHDVRLYQAETFAKYTGVTEYDQPFHVDYTNHTMLPPRHDRKYGQVTLFLFLTDVSAEHGPTKVVSRQLTDDFPLSKLNSMGEKVDSDQVAVWEKAATSAIAPRGSLFVYAPNVLHRGTNMSIPGGARFFFNLGYKSAGADWVGANPWPRKGFYEQWEPLVNRCSVRQLEVLGFPAPGHDYWDETTLHGAAERYPELDLRPWCEALEKRSRMGTA